jgi:membrane-associated protease RseP (regulator of RpoE activity)
MLDLETITTIIFFVLIGILLVKDRKKVQFFYGIIIRRWKKGKETIDKLVKHKKFLQNIGDAAIVVGLLASVFSLYILIIFNIRLQQAFAPVLPSIAGYTYPKPIVTIPSFWYWIIGIFIVIASHETMHAIFSRMEKIPIKNYGVLLFLFWPLGAFVDIDMKKIKKLKFTKKLRIFTAGSFGNIVFGFIFLFLAICFSRYFYVPVGVGFEQTQKGFPAYEANLSGIITSINNQKIRNLDELVFILNNTKPGEIINITTTAGNYSIKTVNRPDNKSGAYIGISGLYTFSDVKKEFQDIKSVISWIWGLLFWLFIISMGVGFFNMLPIKPLDGGLVYEEIFKKFLHKRGKIVIRIVSIFILALLLFNIFGIGILK